MMKKQYYKPQLHTTCQTELILYTGCWGGVDVRVRGFDHLIGFLFLNGRKTFGQYRMLGTIFIEYYVNPKHLKVEFECNQLA
jgi:hypothetical protein